MRVARVGSLHIKSGMKGGGGSWMDLQSVFQHTALEVGS